MTVPTYVSHTVSGYVGGTTTYVVTFPPNRVAGDLMEVCFIMQGTLGKPHADWEIKAGGNNAQVVAYCRVGSGDITTGSGALTLTFTNGGSALYFLGWVNHISGALASGDPYDVAISLNKIEPGTTTAAVSLTSATDDCLFVWSNGQIFATNYSVSAGPSGMTMVSSAAAAAHAAWEAKATAGGSGSKQATYSSSQYYYSYLSAIKPAVTSTLSGDSILAGAKKDNAGISVMLAGAKKTVATKSTILAGTKKVNS